MVILACRSPKGHHSGPSASRTQPLARCKCHHYHSVAVPECVCLSVSSASLSTCLSVFLLPSLSFTLPLSSSHTIDSSGCKYLHALKPRGSISVRFCLALTRIVFLAHSVIGSLFLQLLFIIYIVCVFNDRSSNFNISFK